MFRLIYTSRSHKDLTAEDISVILTYARRRNAQDGITGLLLYHNRMILQVLEGEEHAVRACYDRICRDNRHADLRLRFQGPVDSIFFTDWFMGYDQLNDLPALGRIAAGKSLISLDQLSDRLVSVRGVETTNNKQAVIGILKQYLYAAQQAENTAPA